MSSLLTDLSVKCELQEMDILALRKQVFQFAAENAKLRKLADAVKEFVEDTHCEDCSCRRDCDDNNRIFCVNDFSYHAFAAMRALGIEVELRKQVRELEDETAELKELVRDFYRCGDSCTHCSKYWNQGDGCCGLGVGWKARRLKELGIEVDDE